MARRRFRERFRQSLQDNPLALTFWAAVLLAGTIWICNEHGWRPMEDTGGIRHGPLWIMMLGIPLFGGAFVLGIMRTVRGLRERRQTKCAEAVPVQDAPVEDARVQDASDEKLS